MQIAQESIPPAPGGEPFIHWALPLGGLALSLAMFFISKNLRKRHWIKVKAQTSPSEFAAVWTDVFYQLVAALAILLGFAALLILLFAPFRPHVS